MTMFGVTMPCVTAVRQQLEAKGYDCLVFHATGAGGRAMEQLVASGLLSGVLDVTTPPLAYPPPSPLTTPELVSRCERGMIGTAECAKQATPPEGTGVALAREGTFTDGGGGGSSRGK